MTWKLEADSCRMCGAQATELHHIVTRRITKRGHTDALRNGMPLCAGCHRGHHERTQAIPRSCLTPVEEAFALGAAGEVWLDTWYPKESK